MDGKGWVSNTSVEEKSNPISSNAPYADSFAEAFTRKIEKLIKYTNFIEIPKKANISVPKNKSLIDFKIKQLNKQHRPYILKSVAETKQVDPIDYQKVIKNDEDTMLRYMSKGNAINLNCKVIRKDNGEKIQCRHLAQAYVQGTVGAKGNKFSKVSTPSKLSANLDIPSESQLNDQIKNKLHKESYYVHQDNLGLALLDLVEKQKSTGTEVKSYLLSSFNHVMGLKVKVSPDREEVVVDYYDPNITNKVEHIILPSSKAVASLSIHELIGSPYEKNYFPDENITCCITSLDTMEELKDCDVKIIGPVTYPMMCDLLTRGHFAHDAIKQQVQEFIQDNSQDMQTLEKILVAGFFKGYPPALHMLLLYGYTDSLRNYMQEVLKSPLDDATKEKILTSEMNGVPVLNNALAYDYKKGIHIYMDEILKSNLKADAKERLISARDQWGLSSFFSAMEVGTDSRNICVFMEKVLSSELSLDAKKRLLSAKTQDEVSALMTALEATGNTENIKMFADVMLKSPLSDDDKHDLLNVLWNGNSVLDMAKNKGFTESVDVFEHAVKKSNLKSASKASLLNRGG